MNPHITKQYHRELLYYFWGGDVRFLTIGPNGLPNVHSASKLLNPKAVLTLYEESTHQKAVS